MGRSPFFGLLGFLLLSLSYLFPLGLGGSPFKGRGL
jgi:hypothetical protein